MTHRFLNPNFASSSRDKPSLKILTKMNKERHIPEILMQESFLMTVLPKQEWENLKAKLDYLIDVIENKESKKRDSEMLTPKEVCQVLKISSKTFKRYRDLRMIPYTQCFNKVLVKRKDLDEFIQKNGINR